MNNLNIKSVRIRNFRSFGDEEVVVDLTNRGPVLVLGQIDDGRSNGAGKSSLVEAIIWCLFGRLSSVDNPGEKIVNWITKGECIVSIDLDDGVTVIRSRIKGKPYLKLMFNGSPLVVGDSSAEACQSHLHFRYGLDFNSFISYVYFGQFSGSFLGLADVKKKRIIEKLFGLAKIPVYIETAKARFEEYELEGREIRREISNLEDKIVDNENRIESLLTQAEKFEEDRNKVIDDLELKIKQIDPSKLVKYNMDIIRVHWDTINGLETKLGTIDKALHKLSCSKDELLNKKSGVESKKLSLNSKINKLDLEIKSIDNEVNKWKEKSGSVCPICSREFDVELISSKVDKLVSDNSNRVDKLKVEISDYQESLVKVESALDQINIKLGDVDVKYKELMVKRGKVVSSCEGKKHGLVSIDNAIRHNEYVDKIDKLIASYNDGIAEEKAKRNPFISLVDECKNLISDYGGEIGNLKLRRDEVDSLASHCKFICSAYSNKSNIPSFITSNFLPVLNDRLAYYFNELNLEFDMAFNERLGITSSKWDYGLFSGGEKKRIDLALMCALHDTFVGLHGNLCNILVLDEIDKELDKRGVEDFARLVVDDLSGRFGTILVISHKSELCSFFPTQLVIRKNTDGCSTIGD